MDPIDTYLEIRRCAARAEAGMSRAAKHVGLTPAQAAALVLLARHGPRPISRFSRALSINLSSLTQVADGLERAGYAKRRYSETDRRIHELVITDRGREAVATFLAALHSTAQQKDGSDTRPALLDRRVQARATPVATVALLQSLTLRPHLSPTLYAFPSRCIRAVSTPRASTSCRRDAPATLRRAAVIRFSGAGQ